MDPLSFPSDFLWGTATAAYQIEGAAHAGGRGRSVWDTFSHTPGKTAKGDTGDVACDHYHRFAEDVRLMAELGFPSYRFSLSWPRILPEGTGAVNEEGLAFYDRLLDELVANGIEPAITLFHWDYPQALHDLGGWTHPDASKWFGDYAELCFKRFGDRCKFWITLNEPWCYAYLGHGIGVHAPGIVSETLPYEVGHGLLLGHGEAVARYRALGQDGKIGLTTNHNYATPYSDSEEDLRAVRQFEDWNVRWFLDPIYKGDYPEYLKSRYAMPEFTPETSRLVSQPTDFMGLNFYVGPTIRWALGHQNDAEQIDDPSVDHTAMGWMILPDSLRQTLVATQKEYGPAEIYVTENGCAFEDVVVDGQVNDERRVKFLRDYLRSARKAIAEGVNLKGYFIWSFLDNFEWAEGYRPRFGLVHVDFETQVRTPKDSALMMKRVITENSLLPANEAVSA